jgi:unsaturated chondroitin disaccharide hydrolase
MSDNPQIWSFEKMKQVQKKIYQEMKRLGDKTPYIAYDGQYSDVVEERGYDWWANGFWSGILWQLFHYTGDAIYEKTAIEQEKRLDRALYEFRDIHHDVGFLWLHSAVAHYRETKDAQAKRTGLHAATTLAGRFNIDGNYLVAWNDHKPGWLIVDSMMNIPLLYWASNETQDPRFSKIARKHADTVAKYLIRADGSVGHIASFNAETGEFIKLLEGQGYSENSSWSRGTSWAIYGFALSYHHGKNSRDLAIAKKIAAYFISNIEETNYIPRVDFKAPKEPDIYDTSAGLCAACGLMEIAQWCEEAEKERYKQIAFKIIQATEKQYANWNLSEDGIIGGGTEAYHRPATSNVALIYSDYFFIEALLRILNQELFIW